MNGKRGVAVGCLHLSHKCMSWGRGDGVGFTQITQTSPWGLSVCEAAESQVASSSSDHGTQILIGSLVGIRRGTFIVIVVPFTHNDLLSWVFTGPAGLFLGTPVFGKQCSLLRLSTNIDVLSLLSTWWIQFLIDHLLERGLGLINKVRPLCHWTWSSP